MVDEIDKIDKQIEQLKLMILQKYNNSITTIEKDIANAKEAAIEKVVLNRAALIKELDDRLALIKQFPSVLEADLVTLKDIDNPHSTSEIRFYTAHGDSITYLDPGKWKVLVLAKKVR